MNRFTPGRVLAFGALTFLLTTYLCAQQKAEWTWKDQHGNIHTRAELDTILKEHEAWVESVHKPGYWFNLRGADLRGADLSHANLTDADLSDVKLHFAVMLDANLARADLFQADLTRSIWPGADLRGARLYGADLRGADLLLADLAGADLRDADLTDARLWATNLGGTTFEPKSVPEVREIARAKNLELLRYENNPDALGQLRKLFADGGFREQERKITYALERREAERSREGCTSRKTGDKTRAVLWSSDSNLANCGSFVLNRVFFDWTCQYGMSPGRPLSFGVSLWLLCSVLYFVCIHVPGSTGLYRVYAQPPEDPSAHRKVEEIVPRELKTHGLPRFSEFLTREWRVLSASMFFSLMSAFNIGFRDINFGRWLRLLTRQEFDIKAVGWARVIAGWQSLISVYLLALWVLSYFGRPFG